MFTVIVKFRLPKEITREEIISNFEETVPKWRDTPDLIRKNYLIDLDKGIAGGVYLWSEKIHADIWLGAEFRKKIKDSYGEEPTFQFFETPIIVDNMAESIIKE